MTTETITYIEPTDRRPRGPQSPYFYGRLDHVDRIAVTRCSSIPSQNLPAFLALLNTEG
jgi:hypothetical protein